MSQTPAPPSGGRGGAQPPAPPPAHAGGAAAATEPTPPAAETAPAPGSAPAPRNPAKKVALLVLVLLVVLTGWYVLTDRHAPYTSRGTVSTYVTQITPRVGGQVEQVFVHDNQAVARGTPLFALDPRPFELAVHQAEAALAQATQGIDASSAGLAASQAEVVRARAHLDNTRTATARTLALAGQQLVSRADADNARASLRTAQAQLEAAQAGLRSAELQLGSGGIDNPQIRSARLQLEQAQLNLLYATVEAPRDGRVTNLQLAVGQYAAPGSPALTFVDTGGAWVTADLRENQLGNIAPGDRVGILFDAVPGTIFQGQVHSIAGAIDPGRASAGGLLQNAPETRWFEPARRFPVRVELDPEQEWPSQVHAGAKVSVVVYTSGTDNPVAWIARGLHRAQSIASYLY